MRKFRRSDLYSLEEYSEERKSFRARVMAHKQDRRLPVGPNITLYFEDRLTIQYQIQEMLRIEKTFDAEGINDELKVYNPLIPDGSNWKATMMVEFENPEDRSKELARLVGIEHAIWLQIDDEPPVRPVADEDLDRASDDKTSAVHFLRFELTPAMIKKLKNGAGLAAGVDHDAYNHRVDNVPDNIRLSLVQDLD